MKFRQVMKVINLGGKCFRLCFRKLLPFQGKLTFTPFYKHFIWSSSLLLNGNLWNNHSNFHFAYRYKTEVKLKVKSYREIISFARESGQVLSVLLAFLAVWTAIFIGQQWFQNQIVQAYGLCIRWHSNILYLTIKLWYSGYNICD